MSGGNTKSRCSTICGARCRPSAGGKEADSAVDNRKARWQLPEENMLYFLEKNGAASAAMAARDAAHRPHDRAVLLSAAQTKLMNEGCATYTHYSDHEPSARERPDDRRHHAGVPAFAHQRRVPAGLRRSALFSGINPYALGFAMMRGYRAHLPPSRPPRTGLVPRHRRQRRPMADAARSLGQLPRRKLHPPVSEPAPDARSCGLFHVRNDAFRAGNDGRGDPQRARLPQDPQALARQYDIGVGCCRYPGGRCRSCRRPAS